MNNSIGKPARSLVRLLEVVELTGLSRQQINRLEAVGGFPKRRKISARCVAFFRHEIDEWLDNLPLACGDDAA